MDMKVFLQNGRIFQVSIKLAQPFPAPENCGHEFFTDTKRIFLNCLPAMTCGCQKILFSGVIQKARLKKIHFFGSFLAGFPGGRFRYFLFFLLRSGEGKGESGATGREGGSVFLLKIPGGGGVVSQRGWEGARGPGGCLQGIWGNWGGGGG